MATIKETYALVPHLETLFTDETIKKEIREKMFSKKDTEQHPINFHTILFRLDLVPGSNDSLMFHNTLDK